MGFQEHLDKAKSNSLRDNQLGDFKNICINPGIIG